MPYRVADGLSTAGTTPTRAALVRGERRLSFGELDARAGAVAGLLRAAGLGEGDRLLLAAGNAIETFEVILGCSRAGVVAVPVDVRLTLAELLALAADAGPRAVVADETLAPGLLNALADGALSATVPVALGLGTAYQKALATTPAPGLPVPANPDRVVLQVYTSGTSGTAKGVLITEANLAAKVGQAGPRWGFGPASVSLLSTPLSHIGALSWGLVGIHAGATTILGTETDGPALVRRLRDERVTHAFLVPTLLDRIAAAAGSERFPDLQTVLYGAAPSSAQTRERAQAALGPVLHQVYGLTETTGSITELTPEDARGAGGPAAGSVGRPYPWVTIEIRDPASGTAVATGTPGEVWTHSAQNTPGYAGRPAATAALLTADGWLRTGDVGWLDADGLLHLTDRLSDLIVTGGDNVSPAEVEEVLRRHPDVADAAVFGVPDPRWGEAVTAAVVLREGATATEADLAALAAHAAGGLAAYKRPQRIHVRTELPRNAAGKVLRRALKETYAP